MKTVFASAILALGTCGVLVGTGCTSSKSDAVTTTGRSQYTSVHTTVIQTTDIAKQVLMDHAFKKISADSSVDEGNATGYTTDDRKIHIYVTKKDGGSSVQVTVGTLGGPDLGAELAKDIKMKADGMSMNGAGMGTMNDGTMHDNTMHDNTMRSGTMRNDMNTMGRDPATMPMR